MEQLFDIHCHILPGVDDGSQTMEDTIAMLQCAVKDGITDIIATPHYHLGRKISDYDKIEKAYQDTVAIINSHNLPLKLYLGNEVFCSDNAIKDVTDKKAHTMNSTRYVLLEFHPSHSYREIWHGAHAAISNGFIPIVAHVDRYPALVEDIERIEELINLGCYIQVNTAGIMGDEGFRVKQFCKKLLKDEFVHFVATDAHRPTGKRIPKLKKCADYIKRKYGIDYARAIFETNPNCVLVDKYI